VNWESTTRRSTGVPEAMLTNKAIDVHRQKEFC
jgi:hypothetical protein